MRPTIGSVVSLTLLTACPPPEATTSATDPEPTASTSTTDSTTSTDASTSSTTTDATTSTTSTTTDATTSTTTSTTTDATSTTTSTTADDSTSSGSGTDTEGACVTDLDKGEDCYGAAVDYGLVEAGSRILLGDLDLDGHLDVVVVGYEGGVTVWFGDGSGALGPSVDTPTEPLQNGVLGDFDGDGDPDLAISLRTTPPRIDVLTNEGGGTFTVSASFLTEPTVALSLEADDFDEDGDVDVVAVHQGKDQLPKRLTTLTNDGGPWIHKEQPLMMFVAEVTMDAWTPFLTKGDLDGAHTDVIVTLWRTYDKPHRFRSNGVDGFDYLGPLSKEPNQLNGLVPIVVHDVDGDGVHDLVTSRIYNPPTLAAIRNLGGGATWEWMEPTWAESSPVYMALGELLPGPEPEVAYGGHGDRVWVRTVAKDGVIASPAALGFLLGFAGHYALGDLNGDGRSDFVFVHWPSNELRVRVSE